MKRTLISATLALLAVPALAQVTINQVNQPNVGFTVSSTDLLQTSLVSATSTGKLDHVGVMGLPALTNGVFGSVGFQPVGGEGASADGSVSVTFTLAGTGGAGVDIGQIVSYAGWDGNRGGQAYTVSYATADAPGTFVNLATVFFNATTPGGDTNTRVTIGSATGLLASNVQTLRFAFADGLDYGFAMYREIDVFGVSAVPEASSWALMAAGLAAVGAAVRRQRRALPQA